MMKHPAHHLLDIFNKLSRLLPRQLWYAEVPPAALESPSRAAVQSENEAAFARLVLPAPANVVDFAKWRKQHGLLRS